MDLFQMLKEVEKLGYEILTYEEAKEELGVIPENVDEIYFYFDLEETSYFILNISKEEIKQHISIFLKEQKLNLIKSKLFNILQKNKDAL